jgi:hypothetical protein
VSESDWVSKYEAIKSKLPAYKGMKRELGELEAEVRRFGCVAPLKPGLTAVFVLRRGQLPAYKGIIRELGELEAEVRHGE